ncbi:MAG: transcriptional regulator of sulfur oxidation SoxR [Roseibaca calidilacus]|uniref:Transcriptional regulator of sulfur oxidation SoxR n=1 Tax=Roseibaca calidilacus TaxID=1666912 RepID=A0A0P7VWU3_9RHOB|nr:metalloregulator ArsR/SmtB family transcription factor [Roseibaca calidilacus]KPP91627.1 MAG: transcriptional regulator of sulfur oxidation SoxR [Roseibaca calidilacus]CUX82796.1 transcriptional regulator, ArsR family [Roseibaca calidilacus]
MGGYLALPDGQSLDHGEPQHTDRPAVEDALLPTSALCHEDLQTEARAAADFLKAMGHEGRLLMLYHLCERDCSVTELEKLILSRQAAVSQQLARLRHEKLVTTRREGNQIIYSLADERVREAVLLMQRMFRQPKF